MRTLLDAVGVIAASGLAQEMAHTGIDHRARVQAPNHGYASVKIREAILILSLAPS